MYLDNLTIRQQYNLLFAGIILGVLFLISTPTILVYLLTNNLIFAIVTALFITYLLYYIKKLWIFDMTLKEFIDYLITQSWRKYFDIQHIYIIEEKIVDYLGEWDSDKVGLITTIPFEQDQNFRSPQEQLMIDIYHSPLCLWNLSLIDLQDLRIWLSLQKLGLKKEKV